jgi:hypothetical protein
MVTWSELGISEEEETNIKSEMFPYGTIFKSNSKWWLMKLDDTGSMTTEEITDGA